MSDTLPPNFHPESARWALEKAAAIADRARKRYLAERDACRDQFEQAKMRSLRDRALSVKALALAIRAIAIPEAGAPPKSEVHLLRAAIDQADRTLSEIADSNIPDCPSHYAGDELAWAQRHVGNLRRRALATRDGIQAVISASHQSDGSVEGHATARPPTSPAVIWPTDDRGTAREAPMTRCLGDEPGELRKGGAGIKPGPSDPTTAQPVQDMHELEPGWLDRNVANAKQRADELSAYAAYTPVTVTGSGTTPPADQGKPVAWGRVISGKAVTLSRERTPANDEPLYTHPDLRVQELEAALRPFATEADMWGDQVPEDHAPVYVEMGKNDARYFGSPSKFTIGDLRRARAALGTTGGER